MLPMMLSRLLKKQQKKLLTRLPKLLKMSKMPPMMSNKELMMPLIKFRNKPNTQLIKPPVK